VFYNIVRLKAKMKTVEEQHADYQKHISVLKESLIAKEEHYNMLQMDVSLHICVSFSHSYICVSTESFSTVPSQRLQSSQGRRQPHCQYLSRIVNIQPFS
jgi:hypothetical protein